MLILQFIGIFLGSFCVLEIQAGISSSNSFFNLEAYNPYLDLNRECSLYTDCYNCTLALTSCSW